MCGIYGRISLSGDPDVGIGAGDGLKAIVHRGPDDVGTYEDAGVFLGMTRLSILDLEGGHQPMCDRSGRLTIVYNGELYNFRELRAELEARGHRFRTSTDTEVVLESVAEWGSAALRRMNGMFAFAIWDRRERTLFLARDRLGEKPLYLHHRRDRFAFASEIKAILSDPDVERAIDPVGLSNYLAFGHALAPRTMFRGIEKLEPGHWLLLRDGMVSVRRWWDVGERGPSVVRDDLTSEAARRWSESGDLGLAAIREEVAADAVRDLLEDSVTRRLVADVPVGAFLSGGVDSTAIVAIARRHAGPIDTFSLGFGGGGAYDERDGARRVAAALGTRHHELDAGDLDLPEALTTLVRHYDEPFADEASLPVYLLSRLASQHVKVVLTGDGGDELFGGYRRYAADRLAPTAAALHAERWAPQVADRLSRARRIRRAALTLPLRDPARRYSAWLEVFSPEMRASLLAPALREAATSHDPGALHADLYGRLNGTTASDHVNRLMYIDLKSLLPDAYLEKTDKATMACGLEARLPFLDHRLVELAFAIPGSAKIRGGQMKVVLRRAVRDLVPAHVLQRPKHGFEVPIDPWFRGELRPFALDVLLGETARSRGLFDPRVVERLWREHAEGRAVRDRELWTLLQFELWHREYLDGVRV